MASTASLIEPAAKGAWRTLAILVAIYLFHFVDRSVLSIVLEPVKAEFNLSDSDLGLLTGLVYALTYALAGIPLGILVDRVSRKRLLAGLIFVWSGATMACGLAQSYWQLVVARFSVGAAEAGGAPASMSIISDMFPKSRRGTALGIFWCSTAFAAALTFALGSWAVQQWGWRSAFLFAGAPGIALGLVLLVIVKEPRRGTMDREPMQPRNEKVSTWSAVRLAVRQPTVLPVFVAMTLNSIVASGSLVWIVSFLMRTQGLTVGEAGMIAGLAALIFGVSGTFLGGFLADRLARRGFSRAALVPGIASIGAAFAQFGLASAPTVVVAIVAYAAFELTFRTSLGPGYNLLLTPIDANIRGLASSAMQVSTNLIGWGMGPLIVGAVSDQFGGPQSLRAGIAVLAFVNFAAAAAYLATWWLGERKQGETKVAAPD